MNLSHGQVIREPVGNHSGFWTGAPGAYYEPAEKAWYLTYRLRRPRGVEPDRGGEARIARSTDLKNWADIWTVNKNEYKSASIERGTIHRGSDKIWRYFTSYVNPADGRWCVAMLRGTDAAQLYARNVEIVFTAKPLGLEGIKDPWILWHDDRYYMFLSVALSTPKTTDQSHATLDIYNTGECISATGLATSRDLDQWEWKGIVFRPEATGWDRYCRRINSVVPVNGNFIAFYDGSAGHEENYEEKTGVAVSPNLQRWQALSLKGPAHISPHGSHSLRYMDAHVAGKTALVFYESARMDGAHELRLLTMDKGPFLASLERLLPAELRPA
jgi:hypothetical protein